MEAINGVKVIEDHDDVLVVTAHAVLSSQLGPDYWMTSNFEEESAVIKKWLEDNNAHYYSDVKEDFFTFKGVDGARAAGKSIVVVENLS